MKIKSMFCICIMLSTIGGCINSHSLPVDYKHPNASIVTVLSGKTYPCDKIYREGSTLTCTLATQSYSDGSYCPIDSIDTEIPIESIVNIHDPVNGDYKPFAHRTHL